MNEYAEANAKDATLLAEAAARSEAIGRADLWSAALVHAALLLIAFLALVIAYEVASDFWPAIRLAEQSPLKNIARLALLAMAAWVFVSTARRAALTRQIEIDLLRAEIKEIQKRAAHF